MADIWVGDNYFIRYVREGEWRVHEADGSYTGSWFTSKENAIKRIHKLDRSARKKPAKPSPFPTPSIKFGLISDTGTERYDAQDLAVAAAAVFARSGCKAVIHAGDTGGYELLEALGDALGEIPLYWVLGNHDTDLSDIEDLPGIKLSAGDEEWGEAELFGFKVGVAHGTYGPNSQKSQDLLKLWLQEGKHDLLVYGHFHQPNLRFPTDASPTLVIDPGGVYAKDEDDNAKPQCIAILDMTKGLLGWKVSTDGKGFEDFCQIDIDTREVTYGPGADYFLGQSKPWRSRAKEKLADGKMLPGNWGSASKYIDKDPSNWLSHEALWKRKSVV